MISMKQFANNERQKYKKEKAKGHVLIPDALCFLHTVHDYDPVKIDQHCLEALPKVCPPEEEYGPRL